ncbi:MAG: FAD-dependent oxidoreductase [Gammaproteobacteria bacterium]|nr:FAD-dependent oxidoreductase [Gammaproteobacteria bacterium]
MHIAVIGSGIAGLSTAWLLSREHRVTLYESGDHLGGHAHTVDVTVDGITAPVDTGFLVFNHRTYPRLVELFAHLGVPTAASDMSFSVQLEEEGVEWAGTSLATLFARPRNLFRAAFWRMLRDIPRFNRMATEHTGNGSRADESLGDYLRRHGFSREFRDWYLLPMAGAIWSCPTGEMLDYPVASFARFCHNHGLLQLSDRPQWHTVRGGSREYVRRLAEPVQEVRLADPVVALRRLHRQVAVISAQGGVARYDHAVVACHPDQALRLLADADADERRLLGAVPYQPNRAVLHTDAGVMPRDPAAWSAWNYHAAAGGPDDRPVGVSYWLNRLQPLPFRTPVIVTLNPNRPIAADRILGEYAYDHPVFDFGAVAAQGELARIQGTRRTWYCGAWTGYGFHEDGLRSGLEVARRLGVEAPWRAARRAA